jgi:glycosyltransferase involved in cell wall biosynthesis
MSTYNGERWVDVQLATIFAQDYGNWTLTVRDDGSTDSTLSILKAWRDRYPLRVKILDENEPNNVGVPGSFTKLLGQVSSPYFMLAGADDVWYRNKVSSAVNRILTLEEKHGDKAPILAYTDLRMVDGNLHELHRSALKHLGMSPARNPTIGRFCLENTAYGCTVIGNRILAELAIPIPDAGRCEDWWLSLVATAFGATEGYPEISMDWRRHGENHSKTSSMSSSLMSLLRNPAAHRRSFYSKIEFNEGILAAFLAQYRDRLRRPDRQTIEAFLKLRHCGFWSRRAAILKHRIWYSSWLRMAGLILMA